MKKRETLTVNVPPMVAKAFREVVAQYGGKVGACVAGAMALFIRATPEERKQVLQDVYTAELEGKLEPFLQPPQSRGSGKKS
ncbi:MAG TPA: hypothetical protein VGN72_19935 [Tepidisphaeraceae bacterium]|jgi:hypothetical protein|nr:hypothetical protein [Tepidisphaeraceae bacterium]